MQKALWHSASHTNSYHRFKWIIFNEEMLSDFALNFSGLSAPNVCVLLCFLMDR